MAASSFGEEVSTAAERRPHDAHRLGRTPQTVSRASWELGARRVAVDQRAIDEGTASGDAETLDVEDYVVLFELDRMRASAALALPTRPRAYDCLVIDEALELAPLELAPSHLALDGRFPFGAGAHGTSVDQVKGLELDYVVVPDATAPVYDDDAASRRTLCVAVTRARHQVVVAGGPMAPR